MNRIFRYTIFYLLIFLVIIGIFGTFNGGKQTTEDLDYHEFFKALDSNKVDSITIQPEKGVYKIVGTMKGAKEGEEFTVNILQNDQTSVDRITKIQDGAYPGVKIMEAPQTSGFVTFLTSIIPFVIIIILFFFLLSQSQGGGNKVMNFGKSKAKLFDDSKKKFASTTLQVLTKRSKSL